MNFFGNDFVIQAGGGIHGHPDGTVLGAIAMRQAVDATLQGVSLKEYAKNHKELQEALNIWN
jgi:ribulose-bisphosphate carboxylase large chain